jgi:putative ABC transport system substrate-binding protein
VRRGNRHQALANSKTAHVLAVACALVVAPWFSSYAQQQSKPARIAYFSAGTAPSQASRLEVFKQGLRDLGYVVGKDIVIEQRYADGKLDRAVAIANELVGLKLDIIVTGGPAATRALKQATATIPIVMGFDYDPVASGVITSLAKPGGNITGTSSLNPELCGKRLELLKEAFPRTSRVAVLREAVGDASSLRATVAASRALGVQLQILELRDPNELESAFAAMIRERAGALDVLPGLMITTYMRQIVGLAAKTRLKTIFPDVRFVESGGLMSYGPDLPEMYRRAAIYVDKILKGAKPSELPVEQPTKFEFVINLKTAKQIGITIPQSVLIKADRVIQ